MNEAVSQLQKFCESGEIDKALALESYLYATLVSPVEEENHYWNCFRQWSWHMERAANTTKWVPAKGPKTGFIVHSDAEMAHVKIVAKTCELRPKNQETVVFVMAPDTGHLRQLFSQWGVKVYYLARTPQENVSIQLYRMREICKAIGCGILVWVSLPIWCSYAFATRLAEKQVFWAHRFHPLSSDYIDVYITPGKRSEKTRTYHGQTWKVVHAPLCLDVQGAGGNPSPQLEGFKPGYGTVGRSEKIARPLYLDMVRRILDETNGGFYWTGKKDLKDIRDSLNGRKNQYVGWVDPNAFISQLDVYLEPPSGGLSTCVCWELGIPVVAWDSVQSPYGSVDNPSLLAAKSKDEYIHLALEALKPDVRIKVIEAQKQVWIEEQERAGEDVVRFWDTVNS